MSGRFAGRTIIGCLILGALVGGAPVVVQPDFDPARPVSYAAQVGPLLSLLGCNAGSCHGKAGGQHGFALSLFGADPNTDLRAIRDRVDPSDPATSLLVLKPTAQVPHGGGQKLAIDSADYQTLLRWIGQPEHDEAATGKPRLVRLNLNPARQILPLRGGGQIRVEANWDDGSVVDVTRLSRFESNAPAVVEVSPQGNLIAGGGEIVGEAAILVRFGRDLAVGRVIVPSGRPLPSISQKMDSTIDRLVARKLGELGLIPSPPATDAEFARRSAIDVAGSLPDPPAVEAFERDDRPDKQAQWVDGLLVSPGYADHFAAKWSAILRNRRALGDLSKPTTFGFHAWVRQAIAENWPYDRFVAAIVAAKGDAASDPNVAWFRHVPSIEERTDDVAQVFLGTRIGCARCHHHPTERWGLADYADFAAFFAQVGTKAGPDPTTFRVFHQPRTPAQGPTHAPRPLGATQSLNLAPRDDPRDALVAWMVGPGNPDFARAIVNRYWKHFFGQGLVEPEDDFRSTNPPTDPELLDTLARELRAHGFDLKWLIRTITTSQAYARSSIPDASTPLGQSSFARYTPKRLSAEVLLDAIDLLTGASSHYDGVPPATRASTLPDDGFASPFLDAFGRPGRRTACECERTVEPSLAQALFLLNSAEVEAKLAAPSGRAARYARPDDARPDAAKVAELYRLAFSRPPTLGESALALSFLDGRRRSGQAAAGYADLIWALINTKEFLYNH